MSTGGQRRMRYLGVMLVAALAATLSLALAASAGAKGHKPFHLTVLHNNDGESQLINAPGNEDFGGVARFKTLVHQLRAEAAKQPGRSGSVLVSSGDNFLAGPEWEASLQKGVPFYDSIALKKIGYDAMAIGNHEFDFGPDILADFIDGFRGKTPFVSANLDFSGEPRLQDLVDSGDIVKSLVVRERGKKIGIIGATTEELRFISSPRNVVANAVAPAVQAEIDRLLADGVKIIMLISHLQGVDEDLALIQQLSGLDIAIAGGGDELLANEGDLLVPGDDFEDRFGPYPLMQMNADGITVPVVTTPGDYKYVGNLKLTIVKGDVVEFGGSLRRVAGGDNPDAVAPNKQLDKKVVDPVREFVAAVAENVLGTSEVRLEGRRDPGIRTEETNLGNLVADSLLAKGTELAGDFGAPTPDVAIQNGGGIRNNSLLFDGEPLPAPFTELDAFDILPFSNFVTIVPDIPREQFKELMEHAVAEAPGADGQFAQIAGFTMTYAVAGTAQELDDDGNVTVAGTRVTDIVLDDGTVIVSGGAVVPGAAITIATIDFLARGGDAYPYRGAPFTILTGATYKGALQDFITGPLGGVISAADYPEGGEGRITAS